MATYIACNTTCVQVLSLKLNVWKITGVVNYTFISKVGVLCNGALHWIVSDDENQKDLIIAFDLSKEEFQEIPLPDGARFECGCLGIIQNCLCVYRSPYSCLDRWLMKDYNVKESWDMQQHEVKYDIVNYLRTPDRSFFSSDESWIFSTGKLRWDYVHALVFVESLVSPHFTEGRSKMVPKRDLLVLEQLPDFDSVEAAYVTTRTFDARVLLMIEFVGRMIAPMVEFVHDDELEQILIRLDIKDLIRCKSVCKSWHSLITCPGFINHHLSRSYKKDRFNEGPYKNRRAHRRIILAEEFSFLSYDDDHHHLVGSFNGLVCIFAFSSKLLVGNPSTREVRHLELPPCIGLPSCWGFIYDSSREDYMVIIGTQKGENQTCIQVLSLKSNVWKVIGEVKYTFSRKVGVLCNGALHWIVKDQNNKNLIISYDLSKEEFKEIHQPDDRRYEFTSNSRLGIYKASLCIVQYKIFSFDICFDIWLMRNYNSWELLPDEYFPKFDLVHCIRMPKDYVPPENFFHFHPHNLHNPCEYIQYHWVYLHAPIFVPSLVSPYVNGRPKGAKNNKECQGGFYSIRFITKSAL
ncbi:hypothetical protein SSX86_008943 [Deinandra increscens subsp. villosa]|uniref:F-box domain-containing protein n=1 Tax=Deinandra increscens subsp. villosa TaxID=3103831 RepID=A0AAP0H4G0_9ASTR